MIFWLKTLLPITLAASTTIAWGLDAQQIFERVSPSVVVIEAGDSLGSGVVYGVDNSGLTASSIILTNCHVVKGYTQVTVERLGKKANATVKVCDADRDMAIITLGGVLPTLPVRTTPLKVGEPAFAVGAPQGLELSISQGIVSQLRPTALGKDPMIQTTAAISQGSSGGGLFDGEGRLIGLTTLYYKYGQSLNFAVPVSFVSQLKNTSIVSRQRAPPSQSDRASPTQKCGLTFIEKDYESEFFLDYCKITENSIYKFVWVLKNFRDQRRDPVGNYFYSSQDFNYAVDCVQNRYSRTAARIAVYDYQLSLGKGRILYSFTFPEKEWVFATGVTEGKIWDALCK